MNKLPIEADKYLLEGLTKGSVEEFSNPFDMMIQQERVKHISSGVSMRKYSLSKLVNINSIVKLDNISYHSLCTSGAFNVPIARFDPCFDFDSPDHGVGILPQKKYQKNIAENKKKFIEMKKIQVVNGGGKMWANLINNKGWDNKSQKKQQRNKKEYGDTKSNNGVCLVDGK